MTTEVPTIHTYILYTIEEVVDMFNYIRSKDSSLVAYDIETDGLIEKTTQIYGIGLSTEDHEGFYIPIRHPDGTPCWSENNLLLIITELTRLTEVKQFIMHNGIFDILVTKNNWGVDLTNALYADTILLKHMIDENPPHGLKENAEKYLGKWAVQAQDELYSSIAANGGKVTKEQCDMHKAPTHILGKYCAYDVVITLRLFDIFSKQLEKEKLTDLFYNDEIMPVYKEVVIPMRDKGFPIDVDHFKKLKSEITKDIDKIENEILKDLSNEVEHYERIQMWKEFDVKKGGHFPKVLAEVLGITLPMRNGTITLAKGALSDITVTNELQNDYLHWLCDKDLELPKSLYDKASEAHFLMFKRKYPADKRVFNLGSNDHLKWLFFKKWEMVPSDYTPKGEPKLDEECLELLAGQKPIADRIIQLRKLNKLLSTYIDGILERQLDGVLYTSMLLFGTTSGRFASRNPNLNNLPRLKEDEGNNQLVVKYTNAIRAGLIAPSGYTMIGSDFSSLEPHIAAYVSGDEGLIDIFVTGKDFYSAIGIKQFSMKECSPFAEAENYFGKKYKALRSLVKTYALAAFYGATAPRIAQVTGKSREESQELLSGYFAAFPDVKNFIDTTHETAIKQGAVRTLFGRVRHIPLASVLHRRYGKDLLNYKWAEKRDLLKERSLLKNLLNNAVNFQIQGYAAHCLNRAMLKMTRDFKKENIDAYVALSIHDEVLVIVRNDHAEKTKDVVKQSMETCVDMGKIKLKATPILGKNYADCK